MDIKKAITNFIIKNYQMVIATSGEHPWIATVYYSTDKDLNLYFLSDPNTLHCQQLLNNPKVAISIAKSPQNPAHAKKGVQLYGLAEQILDKEKIIAALNLWKKTLKVTSETYSYEGMIKNKIKGRMFKVTLKKIKFFNQELWEEGKEPILNL